MLFAQSSFKHKKLSCSWHTVYSRFYSSCLRLWVCLGCHNPHLWGSQCATNSSLSSPCRNLPSSAISAVPCCAPICYHRQPFILLKAIHLFHTSAKEGTVVPDSELRRQDQDASSPFPGSGFPVASHRSFNLFIFTYSTTPRTFYLYYRVNICMQFSVCKAFED